MIFIGIDFSLNSIAITFKHPTHYHFVSLINNLNVKSKTFQKHVELSEFKNFDLIKIVRHKDDNYSKNEILKLKNSKFITLEILQLIYDQCGENDFCLGIEGYSYGSAGNSLIDLVTYTSILRYSLLELANPKSFNVYAPTEIKKYIGKGNYNKVDIFDKFILNSLDDNVLVKDDVYKWILTNKEVIKKSKKNDQFEIIKPFDDLVDSYYVVNYLEYNYNLNNNFTTSVNN